VLTHVRYHFGPFILDPGAWRLRRGSVEVAWTPKAFELLALLVRERQRGLTKQQLFDEVWPDTAVTENTLTQRIREIRDALGDDPQEPRYIRTIPRIGYQFVHATEEQPADVDSGSRLPEKVAPVSGSRSTSIRLVPTSHDSSAAVPDELPHAHEEPTETERTAHEATAAALVKRERSPTKRVYAVAALASVIAAASVYFAWNASNSFGDRGELLLSTFDGSHTSPSLSPDGQMIAFLMGVDGVAQVFVKAIRSGEPVQITSGTAPSRRPRWSPRGDQVVFERAGQGIWSVSPLGGVARRIVEEGSNPNFSADGSMLVFERGPGSAQGNTRWGLWLADAAGSNIRPISGTPEKFFWSEPGYPALSPDGKWVAFFSQTAGPRGDFWIVRTEGGGARQITHDRREGGPPVWSGDSRSIIFASERRGSRTLWRATLDGGIEPVTMGAGADDEPDVSRSGGAIVYSHRRNRAAIAVWDPATDARQIIVERPQPPWLPDLSPDGKRIAFFADIEGDMQLFTVALNGTDLRQVTFGTKQENIHPAWSPDGKSLYYYRRAFDRDGIKSGWRWISADGQDDVELVAGWQWSTHNGAQVDPSGRFVLYTRIGADTGDFSRDTTYIRELDTGSERPLELPHLHMASWSPDGLRIAGQRHDGQTAVCDAANGRCASVTAGGRPAWCPDGNHLYIQRDVGRTQSMLWRLDVKSGREERMGTLGPLQQLAPRIGITRDHRVVFTEFREGRSELWMASRPELK
jgi:Tol biopolymer transport system component/DNA-binding winged helix-turn-helix (wHTH) protein